MRPHVSSCARPFFRLHRFASDYSNGDGLRVRPRRFDKEVPLRVEKVCGSTNPKAITIKEWLSPERQGSIFEMFMIRKSGFNTGSNFCHHIKAKDHAQAFIFTAILFAPGQS